MVDEKLINLPKLWEELDYRLQDYKDSSWRVISLSDSGEVGFSGLVGISGSLNVVLSRLLYKMSLGEKKENEAHIPYASKVDRLTFLSKFDISPLEFDRIFFEEAYEPLFGHQNFDGMTKTENSVYKDTSYKYHSSFPFNSFEKLLKLFYEYCNDFGKKSFRDEQKINYSPGGEDYELDAILDIGYATKGLNSRIHDIIGDKGKEGISVFKKMKLNRLVKACYDGFNIFSEYFAKMDKNKKNIFAKSLLRPTVTYVNTDYSLPYFAYYAMLWQEQVSINPPSRNVTDFCDFLLQQIKEIGTIKPLHVRPNIVLADGNSMVHGGLPLIKLVSPSKLRDTELEVIDYKYHPLAKDNYISLVDVLKHFKKLKK